jgi:hypothetical protein
VSDSTSKEYGTVWKYVQITGSGRAVDRAKKLIHIRLERLEPKQLDEMRQAHAIGAGAAEAGSGGGDDGNAADQQDGAMVGIRGTGGGQWAPARYVVTGDQQASNTDQRLEPFDGGSGPGPGAQHQHSQHQQQHHMMPPQGYVVAPLSAMMDGGQVPTIFVTGNHLPLGYASIPIAAGQGHSQGNGGGGGYRS